MTKNQTLRNKQLAANLYELDPKEQIVVLLKLMEFVVPKAPPAQVEEIKKEEPYDFSKLSLEKNLLLLDLLNEAATTAEQGRLIAG